MPDPALLESLKAYVGVSDASSATVRAAHGLALPHLVAIIDDFYAAIEAHLAARGAITGGQEPVDRLKGSLRRWLEELFLGPHDEAYLEKRARIGRVHVTIDLPPASMFTAMDRIRIQTAAVLWSSLGADPARLERTRLALRQIMDIELAIMLETYREDLMAKNRRAERLATIGQFAAGVGHELRSPLGVVESSVFLLNQHLAQGPPDAKVDRHLEKIATEVERSNETTNDLLELARNRPPQPRPTPLRKLLESAVGLANLPVSVAVSFWAPAGGVAALDGDQVTRRLLTNLLLNASQAMDDRGTILLEGEQKGSETRVRVRDSGPGAAPEVRHRIFDALFTTRAKGSGVGLALCRRTAEGHGGTIVLEPTETGASFLLTLPGTVVAEGPLP